MRKDEFPIVDKVVKDSIIAELESLKAKMLGQKMFYTPDIDIIDSRIKELKGE